MNTIKAYAYAKRFGLHGSRLVWRVCMIVMPVIGYAFWQMFQTIPIALWNFLRSMPHEPIVNKTVYGEYPDGTPWFENVEHEAWANVYSNDISRK